MATRSVVLDRALPVTSTLLQDKDKFCNKWRFWDYNHGNDGGVWSAGVLRKRNWQHGTFDLGCVMIERILHLPATGNTEHAVVSNTN